MLPNWHPAAVHFPIALTLTATLLLLIARLRPANQILPSSARLLLFLSAVSAMLAAGLGWHAFQTVEHDAAGHLVMLRHRNWAVASTTGLLLLALWDGLRQRADKAVSKALLPPMLLLSGSLFFTGWLGGEMVYRHGVGVSSSAFASPPVPSETVPQTQAAPEAPPPADSAAAPTPGVHVHKDGKRHRH